MLIVDATLNAHATANRSPDRGGHMILRLMQWLAIVVKNLLALNVFQDVDTST